MKRLTVSSLYRVSGRDAQARGSRVPAVRLTGHWLTRLGFAPGVKLNVRVEQNPERGSALTLEVAR